MLLGMLAKLEGLDTPRRGYREILDEHVVLLQRHFDFDRRDILSAHCGIRRWGPRERRPFCLRSMTNGLPCSCINIVLL